MPRHEPSLGRAGRRRGERGFVLLVVLMMVVALTVTVSMQADVAVSDRLAAVRARSDARARAIAEACLEQATHEARAFLQGGTQDFDQLLDPNDNQWGSWDNDIFLPPGTRRTVVPQSAATGGEREALHQYRLRPMSGGACLLRYDDNNDEFLPPTGLSTDERGSPLVTEGPTAGEQIHSRDRDRSIIITAIGLHPFNDNPAQDATAYQRASSRVTVKALLQSEISSTIAGDPGLWASNLTHGSDNKSISVCGDVGTTHLVNSPTGPPPKRCTAGEDMNGHMFRACGSSDCSSWTGGTASFPSRTSSPGAVAAPPAPTAPGLTIPPENEPTFRLAAVGGSLRGISDGRACKIFFTDDLPVVMDPTVFIYDDRDTNTRATLGADGVTLPPVGPAPVGYNSENCETQATVTVGGEFLKPCHWDAAGDTLTSCAANQSACWKPIGVHNSVNDDFGSALVNEFVSPDFEIVPDAGDPVAFTNGTRTYADLCGSGPATGDDGIAWDSGNWSIVDHNEDNDQFDAGVYWIFDGNPVTDSVQFNEELRQDTRLAIVSSVPVVFDEGVDSRCPTCGTPGCATVGVGPTDHWLWAPRTHCSFKEIDNIRGHITCRTIQIEEEVGSDRCVVGDLVATDNCGLAGNTCGLLPPAPPWDTYEDFCYDDTDCADPGICIKHAHLEIFGSVLARGNISLEKHVKITGDSIAALDSNHKICLKDENELTATNDIWAAGDLILHDKKNVLSATTIGAGGQLHSLDEEQQFFGKVHVDSAHFEKKKILIQGQLHAVGLVDIDEERVIIINDSGSATTSVDQNIIWMEQSW